MTATDITRGAQWKRSNAFINGILGAMSEAMTAANPPAPCRFPASLASHPAFTQPCNAKLVAIGMAATMGAHRRMGG